MSAPVAWQKEYPVRLQLRCPAGCWRQGCREPERAGRRCRWLPRGPGESRDYRAELPRCFGWRWCHWCESLLLLVRSLNPLAGCHQRIVVGELIASGRYLPMSSSPADGPPEAGECAHETLFQEETDKGVIRVGDLAFGHPRFTGSARLHSDAGQRRRRP